MVDPDVDCIEDTDIDSNTEVFTKPAEQSTVIANGRPNPTAIRGRCPECGDDVVSNIYYVGGRGYLCVWECWGSLGDNPGCTYRRVK